MDKKYVPIMVQGDLFQILSSTDYPHGSYKLAVTSPPYYNARNYGGKQLFENKKEWEDWCLRVIELLKDAITFDGVIWWNTGSGYENHRKMTNVYRLVNRVEDELGIYLIDEIPWCKTSGPPKRFANRPPHMWEHNYIFAKNPDKVTFYRDHVREPYSKATLQRMKYKVSNLQGDKDGEFTRRKKVEPNPLGKVPNNYLLLPQDTTARPHPAPMLPALANWAIRAYTEEGDAVIDPMMGIGTTAIEATKLNRQFLGIELFDEYLQIARLSLARYLRGDNPYRGLKKEWEEQHNE